MFSKGDLVFLNDKGKLLFERVDGEHGIIMTDRYLIYELDCHRTPDMVQFYAYDVLIRGRLFKKIPERFLLRVIENEKNIE